MKMNKVYLLPALLSFGLFILTLSLSLSVFGSLTINEVNTFEGIDWAVTEFLEQIKLAIIYILFPVLFGSVALACSYKALLNS